MDIQLSVLQFLQSIRNPALDILFLGFTISTELPVVILFSSLMYWCINKKNGQKLLFALTGNIMINGGLKSYIKAPRPIGIEGLEPMRVSTATGYAFPSGHTQTATTFWTSLMIMFKGHLIYILGIIVILAVGISRLYLGVHWPVDVLGGWFFGVIFTILLIKLFEIVDKNKNYYILILLLIPAVAIMFILNDATYVKKLGLFTGFVLGYIVEDMFIQFKTNDTFKEELSFSRQKPKKLKRNIYRFLVGILTLGLVYIVLSYTMNSTILLDYIRYTIVIFYGMAGVPALFKILKLD